MKRKRLDESLTKEFWWKLTGRVDNLPKIDTTKLYVDQNGSVKIKPEPRKSARLT